jgi:integrase
MSAPRVKMKTPGIGTTSRRTRVEKHPGVYYRTLPGGKRRYEITFVDEFNRRRWLTVHGNLAAADVALAERKRRRGEGEPVAPGKVRFEDFARTWLDGQQQLRNGTKTLYRGHLERHVYPRLGHRWLHEIREDEITGLISELRGKGLSAYTIRGVLVPLGRILSNAVRRKLIHSNPVSNLERGERPIPERREIAVLNSEQIGKLLAAADETWRPLLASAVFTGLRQSELLGLTWADVDLDAGLVKVRMQLDRSGKRVRPKTEQAIRDVAIFPALGKLLREHKESAFGSGRAKPSDLVFATRLGRALGHRNVARSALDPALERAGLPPMRWHDLRHGFASMLIAQGRSDVFVAGQLGHANANITRSIYGHLFDQSEHAERMRADLEAAYGNVLETTGGDRGRNRPDVETAKVAQLRASAKGGD